MSFSDDSSDPEWKNTKIKSEKLIKREQISPQNKPKYSQKFCDKWLTIFYPWLARCDDDANKPFCRACQCRLDCNRCHLQRHERTTKHARNLEILISKGEGAARQNLSIRQERSKYYQQRKSMNSSAVSSHEDSNLDMDAADEYIEVSDTNGGTAFHFVQTEAAPGDQYTEETILKQETGSAEDLPQTRSLLKNHSQVRAPKKAVKKERMKLLMQIQKDKNDLMDSYKELMGSGAYQSSPPKEKNHVDLFFESVSSSVKALSPKLIAEAKMGVSHLIGQLELRALNGDDPSAAGGAVASPAAVLVSPDVGGAYLINQPVATVLQAAHTQHHQVEEEQHYETLS